MACVTSSNSLNRVSAIIEKPKVTMARNQAFSLTHVMPIRKPIAADKAAAMKIPIIGGMPRFIASSDEVNPPIPRNAACPSEPCPELASRFQLEAYMVKITMSVKI